MARLKPLSPDRWVRVSALHSLRHVSREALKFRPEDKQHDDHSDRPSEDAREFDDIVHLASLGSPMRIVSPASDWPKSRYVREVSGDENFSRGERRAVVPRIDGVDESMLVRRLLIAVERQQGHRAVVTKGHERTEDFLLLGNDGVDSVERANLGPR